VKWQQIKATTTAYINGTPARKENYFLLQYADDENM
jgi:hypothetical protein